MHPQSQFLARSVTISTLSLLLLLAGCVSKPPITDKPVVPPVPDVGGPAAPAEPVPPLQAATFAQIPGWDQDDLRQAWPAFMTSCTVLVRKEEWREPCTVARDVDAKDAKAVRTFFEAFFTPHQVFNPDGASNGLVTGYYEPLLNGSRKRTGQYQTPLYGVPDDMLTIDLAGLYPALKGMRLRGRLEGKRILPYYSRAELTQNQALAGRELLWVDNDIDAFFLQVQGSGRVQLAGSGEVVRLAYADQNGQPYKSIGRYLVDQGELTLDQASAQSIKSWYAANPARRQELLNANPSFVFFKEEKIANPEEGPKGAMGLPLTPLRSIAVDPRFIPLGAPVFLDTTQPNSDTPLRQLMMAQDTGGAIKNPVRADFFWGFGAQAGEQAGKMKQRGALWVLLPKT